MSFPEPQILMRAQSAAICVRNERAINLSLSRPSFPARLIARQARECLHAVHSGGYGSFMHGKRRIMFSQYIIMLRVAFATMLLLYQMCMLAEMSSRSDASN